MSLELYTDLFGLILSNLWRFQDLSFLASYCLTCGVLDTIVYKKWVYKWLPYWL